MRSVEERLRDIEIGYDKLTGFITENRQKQEYAHDKFYTLCGLCNEALEKAQNVKIFNPGMTDSDRKHGEAFAAGIAGQCPDCEPYIELEAENARLKETLEEKAKHIEALKSVCEDYIPADKADEANDEVILRARGQQEQTARDICARIPIAHKTRDKP